MSVKSKYLKFSKEKLDEDTWSWIMKQNNLTESVKWAIELAKKEYGDGDLIINLLTKSMKENKNPSQEKEDTLSEEKIPDQKITNHNQNKRNDGVEGAIRDRFKQ